MTTHLHQLSMISELSRLREVVHLHLSVHYDDIKFNRLIYDRILKLDEGSSVYGLEFAESLHMNPNFLKTQSDYVKAWQKSTMYELEIKRVH